MDFWQIIKPEDLIGENGLLKHPIKALVERALETEMTEHLSYDKHEPVTNVSGNVNPHYIHRRCSAVFLN